MFWIGLIIGLVIGILIGATCGVFIILFIQGTTMEDIDIQKFQEQEAKKHNWRENE